MKLSLRYLLMATLVMGCKSSFTPQPASQPMQTAIDHAWAKIAAMEPDQPALSGLSRTRPHFIRDDLGLVRARLFFAFNSTPYGKVHLPSAADKSRPYCHITVSVWRPNDLPGQPVASQREYRIGANRLEGFVTVFASDDGLASSIRRTFELEMARAADGERSEPDSPPGVGGPPRQASR